MKSKQKNMLGIDKRKSWDERKYTKETIMEHM